MRFPAIVLILAACVTVWSAAAQSPDIRIARPHDAQRMQLSESMLQRLGYRASPCPPGDRFRRNGQFEIKPTFSGSVGEFNAPSDRFLRIDEASSQTSNFHQTAGAVGTWTNGRFAWRKMGATKHDGTPSFPYWKYPAPGQAEVPIYVDKGGLVKIEVNRRQGLDSSTQGFYHVRGCLVDRLPPMLLQQIPAKR